MTDNALVKMSPSDKERINYALQIAGECKAVVIKDNEAYEQYGEKLKILRGTSKELDELRKTKTRPFDEAKKIYTQIFAEPISRLEAADEAVSKARRVYFQDMEDKRRAEEQKARELAEKEAKKLEKRAEKAEEKGQDEKADALREQAQNVAAITPVIESKVTATAGVSMRKVWKFEIIDEAKLPRQYLIADTKKIGEHVRALKADCKIEGVKVFYELAESVRS